MKAKRVPTGDAPETAPGRITLQNEYVRATIVPAMGARMVSLVRRASDHEFLLLCGAAGDYRQPNYGDRFEEHTPCGIDECFPTVQACWYPDGTDSVFLPDHGELWTASWDFDYRDEVLVLAVRGRQLPYRFCKTIRLDKSDIVIDYQIENHGEQPLKYLWSMHPLLRAEPGARIILPKEVDEVFVNWSHEERLGTLGNTCGWPIAAQREGAQDDLSIVKSIRAGSAEKLFSPRLQTGYCALYSPDCNESIGFRFDPKQIPYLGIWLCYGGWPPTQIGSHHAVALEPCSGRPDSLAEAAIRGESELLASKASRSWSLRLGLREGPPQL